MTEKQRRARNRNFVIYQIKGMLANLRSRRVRYVRRSAEYFDQILQAELALESALVALKRRS